MYIRTFKPLAGLCSWAARFDSHLVRNLKDGFSRDGAHIIQVAVVYFVVRFTLPCAGERSVNVKSAAARQNQQNDLSTQRRFGSDWVFWSESWLSACRNIFVLSCPLSTLQRLWSDWADAQADLSLRWAQRSFCWFCHIKIIHLSNVISERSS